MIKKSEIMRVGIMTALIVFSMVGVLVVATAIEGADTGKADRITDDAYALHMQFPGREGVLLVELSTNHQIRGDNG